MVPDWLSRNAQTVCTCSVGAVVDHAVQRHFGVDHRIVMGGSLEPAGRGHAAVRRREHGHLAIPGGRRERYDNRISVLQPLLPQSIHARQQAITAILGNNERVRGRGAPSRTSIDLRQATSWYR